MDLTGLLLAEHSKAQAQRIAALISEGSIPFDRLWACICQGEPPLPQRAAWALDHFTEAHPGAFRPYLRQALQEWQKANHHNAVHRAIAKAIFREVGAVDEETAGPLYDWCLRVIGNLEDKTAIQATAMSIAAHIARPYPELQEELCAIIREYLPHRTAGYASRGKRILSQLGK